MGQKFSNVTPIQQGQTFSNVAPIAGPDPNNPAASIPNPTPKGTLPNAGDTGEGPIAQGLTTFETHLAGAPKAIVKGALAKHWPVIDSRNFGELGEDLKSLNPIATDEGSLPMNIGATAANLLPLAVDMKGGGIAESPIAKVGPPAIRATGKVLNSPIAAPVVGAAIGHSMGEGAAGALVGHALRGTLGKLFGKMETFGESEPVYPGAPEPGNSPPPAKLPAAFEPAGPQYQSPTGSADNPATGGIPRGSVAEAMKQPPITRGSLKQMMESLNGPLDQSVGAKGLEPNVPLRNQVPARGGVAEMMKSVGLAEGHTAVDSSALKSYKYDAGANEFHAQYKSGGNVQHVFGDVSPEEAQAFEKSPSKGTAMQTLKQNHPLVAKIVDGKRVSIRGSVAAAIKP